MSDLAKLLEYQKKATYHFTYKSPLVAGDGLITLILSGAGTQLNRIAQASLFFVLSLHLQASLPLDTKQKPPAKPTV